MSPASLPAWSLACVLWAVLVSGISISPPSSAFLRPRGGPPADAVRQIHRALSSLSLAERSTVQENSTSIDKSWEDAVLFTYSDEADVETKKGNTTLSAGVQITCTTCYIKGDATARFSIAESFNASQAFSNFTTEVKDEVEQLGTAVVDYIENYFDGVVTKMEDGIDLEDFDFPPMNASFDVDLPEIPECKLHFQFDGMELYMLIDTVLSAGATYTLNLYTSNTPIGFAIGKNIEVGVLFAVDLILSVDGEIDISSGFHIKLDDGVTLDLAMFSKEVSDVEFKGGQFEFLPVTIESAGVVLKAVLRLGVTAGFEIQAPDVTIGGISVTEAGVGVEVGVYANVAEFVTNVTASLDEDSDCALQVVESYQLALGAMAGASIAIDEHTWGPVPETQIPIFYTTMASACAIQGRATTTSSVVTPTSGSLEARDDENDGLTTTTLSSKTVYVGVACMSEGLVNCPASLQTTTKFTTTKTYVTVVSADAEATFPETTRTTVVSTIEFGDGAKMLLATSGSPVSYTPPPETTTASTSANESSNDDETDDQSKQNKDHGVPKSTIIGLSVGLGLAALAGIVATTIFWMKKRMQYAAVRKQEDTSE